MKLVLDTCVLYPTVMREMLIGAARVGGFAPLWSAGIEGEWAHTAGKTSDVDKLYAEGEIARLNAEFPKARVTVPQDALTRFWLPDTGDIHVLAAAVLGHADGIVTLNNKDFPAGILAEEGLSRINPDTFLLGLVQANPDRMRHVSEHVLSQARELSRQDWSVRGLMKKARLPRLGKALERLDS